MYKTYTLKTVKYFWEKIEKTSMNGTIHCAYGSEDTILLWGQLSAKLSTDPKQNPSMLFKRNW